MSSLIKLQNVEKYYNKSKTNELHVINNTSLELPNNGLVSFIGKSGCGKTTLLNVIGGLDKSNSGIISYDEMRFDKYKMNKIDTYRKEHIGYIFQNYLLIENLSVYDNLRIALELNNVYDSDEQKKRIEYVLKAVGLYKYRKKPADKLSGGQQQRVSIARALLKQCKVIIADEPTGNLDSENTIDVMNILKKISKKTLVLLVTHNKEIADFYSDRIIEIVDGKIIADNGNISSDGVLDVKNDRNIYLKDLNQENISKEEVKLNLYYDNEHPSIELTVVYKNNTLFIDSPINISLIKQSNTKLINDHYKHLLKEEVNDFDFDISWYKNDNKKSLLGLFFRSLKHSLSNFFHASRRNKIFHFIFFLIGIALGLSCTAALYYSKTDDTYYPRGNTYFLTESDNTYDQFYPLANSGSIKKAIDEGLIDDIYLFNGGYCQFEYYHNSVRKETLQLRSFEYPFSMAENEPLICGKKPQKNQIVIGRLLADMIINNTDLISSYEDIINGKIMDYEISGVSQASTNSIYFDDISYYDATEEKNLAGEEIKYEASNVGYKPYAKYDILEGRDILEKNEILLADSCKNDYAIGDEIFISPSLNYIVVGYFQTTEFYEVITNDSSLLGYTYKYHTLSEYNVANYLSPLDKFNFELVDIDGVKSRLPQNDNEALANMYSVFDIGSTYHGITIVGYYLSSDLNNSYTLLVNNRSYMKDKVDTISIWGGKCFKIHKDCIDELENLGIYAHSMYDYYYNYDINENSQIRLMYLIVMIVFLSISIIYIYFSTRSKLISQIKDVGIYRSIGASKTQIYRKYISNILVETTFTSIIGYLASIIVYTYITSMINKLSNEPKTPIYFGFYIIGAIIVYLLHLVFGLIPVYMLMRKTPAEINSKYDI